MKNIPVILLILTILQSTILASEVHVNKNKNITNPTKFCIDISHYNDKLIEGFSEELSGSKLEYHSTSPDIRKALIARASREDNKIEWLTDIVETDGYDSLKIIWLAGLGVNIGDKNFDLIVNDEKWLTFSTNEHVNWKEKGIKGSSLEFYTMMVDQYTDYFGYMILTLPTRNVEEGRKIKLQVRGEDAGNSAWCMTFFSKDIVKNILKTGKDGFWYQLKWDQHTSDLEIICPESYRHGKFSLIDTENNIYKSQLQPENNQSRALIDLKSLTFTELSFPVEIKIDDRSIDILETLDRECLQSKYYDDGMIVQRNLVSLKDRKILECAGNFFHNSASSILRMQNSYFGKGTVDIVTSSHQDIAWMETPDICMIQRDTMIITPALNMLAKYPHYMYSAEQALMLEEYLSLHPDALEEISRYSREGRLEWGASYNQPYEGMYSGESLIRQFYYGRRWIKNTLPGYDTHTAWNVDVPGRTLQMAQIMKKSGVDYLIISRHGKGLFYWQSPDGSKVGVYSPGHYHGASEFLREDLEKTVVQLPNVIDEWQPLFEKNNIDPVLPILYSSDMSRPHDFSDLKLAWNEFEIISRSTHKRMKPILPDIRYNTIESVMSSIFKNEPGLPVIMGERPNVWLYIHGPTHYKAITASRKASRLLTAAEKFQTIDAVLSDSFDKYAEDKLNEAWKSHIYPDHGWGGKNGQITDNVFKEKSEFAQNMGEKLLTQALERIASKVNTTTSRGKPVIVFNALSWDRTNEVILNRSFEKGELFSPHVYDAKNNHIEAQISDVTKYNDGSIRDLIITFLASDVPPLGYSTYYIREGESREKKIAHSHSQNMFENKFYQIEFANGGLVSVIDKELNVNLFNSDKFMAGEVFMMTSYGNGAGEFAEVQQPSMENFDKTSNHTAEWKKIEDGCLATTFQQDVQMEHCRIVQRIVFHNRVKKIDFEVDILGWDGTKNREFRMALPLNMNDARVTYEVPFGKVTVGEDEIEGAAGERYEQPATEVRPREVQDWINASDSNVGFTMASCVAVCDYVDPTDDPVDYPVLQPLLLASRKSCHGEGNWYLQTGDHHYSFSITSHVPGWSEGSKMANETNQPLYPITIDSRNKKAPLPDRKSFCAIESPDIVISTIKKCEDDESVIMRLYNVSDERAEAKVTWFSDVDHMKKTNLVEEIEGTSSKCDLKNLKIDAYAIETYKFTPVNASSR